MIPPYFVSFLIKYFSEKTQNINYEQTSNIEYIGKNAFADSSLEVFVPYKNAENFVGLNSIKTIDTQAFFNTNLTNVMLYNSPIQKIGNLAFYGPIEYFGLLYTGNPNISIDSLFLESTYYGEKNILLFWKIHIWQSKRIIKPFDGDDGWTFYNLSE